jgi:ABC-type nitrate/sulfonate/bicarbonate transport system ATPase subunit
MNKVMNQSTLALHLEAVSHGFGGQLVLQDIEVKVARGEFIAVVGPSGCGKTTLLNLLSGHVQPTSGRVERQGQARTVYQQDGLFPWLTVEENVALGLRHLPEKTREAQVRELLEWIGLQEAATRYPHQLSGGMKQRVEIARAMAGETDVLLFDEPFSALDYLTRLRMRRELIGLLQQRPRTVVFVTHDIEEAAQLADRILVLAGRPARVSCEVRVDVPQPRSLTHEAVVAATRRILNEMGLEDTGAATDERPPANRTETVQQASLPEVAPLLSNNG